MQAAILLKRCLVVLFSLKCAESTCSSGGCEALADYTVFFQSTAKLQHRTSYVHVAPPVVGDPGSSGEPQVAVPEEVPEAVPEDVPADVPEDAPEAVGQVEHQPEAVADAIDHVGYPSNTEPSGEAQVEDPAQAVLQPEAVSQVQPAEPDVDGDSYEFTMVNVVKEHGRIGTQHVRFLADGHHFGEGATGEVTGGVLELPKGENLPVAVKEVKIPQVEKDNIQSDMMHHGRSEYHEYIVERYEIELEILVHLRPRPHVVPIYAFSEEHMSFALEAMAGGDLQQIINRMPGRRLDMADAVTVMGQVVAAVAECHEHHVVHRDIKEEQFLFLADPFVSVDGWNTPLKLADFGEAYYLNGKTFIDRIARKQAWSTGSLLPRNKGTCPYLPPEVFRTDEKEIAIYKARRDAINANRKEAESDDVSCSCSWFSKPPSADKAAAQAEKKLPQPEKYELYKADIWSLGVVAYQILTGKIFVTEVAKIMYGPGEQAENCGGVPHNLDNAVIQQLLANEPLLGIAHVQGVPGAKEACGFLERALDTKPGNRASVAELQKMAWLQ